MANSLSDHTPILLQFSSSPKLDSGFQYCDIWSKHKDFARIITAKRHVTCKSPMDSLLLKSNQNPFQKTKKEHFLDLKDQQFKARKNLKLLQQAYQHNPRDKFKEQQEKKAKDKFGVDNIRLFYANAKERKLSSYIYSLRDQEGGLVEGFEQVGHTVLQFCRDLVAIETTTRSPIDMEVITQADAPTIRHIMSTLNVFHECAGLKANMMKSQMVVGGCSPQLQDKCLQLTGFTETTFPLKYLGVPITASKHTKGKLGGNTPPVKTTAGTRRKYVSSGSTSTTLVDPHSGVGGEGDLIIFWKADAPTIRHIMSALNVFLECAGLKANMMKSRMVVRGCSPQLQEECLQLMGCTMGQTGSWQIPHRENLVGIHAQLGLQLVLEENMSHQEILQRRLHLLHRESKTL
ncbi:LOW QUALITY PROTEIN: hypothetical protein Cgig2_022623 [Carnegiea gigantea]|uniref:Reverse transcriptase domain-containing protein n=1 Tax=Carnegiea gigantea TaxID=171969 RepID=A0A9Q1JXN5_9CARY|nr:LOW QUALITY PROTEIN: hypothetical protein Cgig2_022623 [Carnegiea gigantea]